MTRRGQATIAALCVTALAVAAATLGLAMGPGVAASSPPPVSAAAPRFRPAPSPPPEILARLPVTKAALELPTYVPSEIAALQLNGPSGEDAGGRLYEMVEAPSAGTLLVPGPLRVEYTLDAELTRQVFGVLRRGRVKLGHVILLEPETGHVLSYASTDTESFPPTRAYPAASLIKVITAATALEGDRAKASLPCRYNGSPYILTPSRIDPPRAGKTMTLRRALATSNNQCFAQLAVHAVGSEALVSAITAFGWLSTPAPAHEPGRVEAVQGRYELGRLGCGLAGSRITPLHAAQLAVVLARGERIEPRWIERVVDARGRELPIPAREAPRRVLSPDLASELRSMLVDTTERGTARSAFRRRNGRPLLGSVRVAGKTGSLSGANPKGRYEWFIGVAPAENPRVAIAVLLVQSDLWWRNASQIGGEVLSRVFCERGNCSEDGALRWIRTAGHPSGAAQARGGALPSAIVAAAGGDASVRR